MNGQYNINSSLVRRPSLSTKPAPCARHNLARRGGAMYRRHARLGLYLCGSWLQPRHKDVGAQRLPFAVPLPRAFELLAPNSDVTAYPGRCIPALCCYDLNRMIRKKTLAERSRSEAGGDRREGPVTIFRERTRRACGSVRAPKLCRHTYGRELALRRKPLFHLLFSLFYFPPS